MGFSAHVLREERERTAFPWSAVAAIYTGEMVRLLDEAPEAICPLCAEPIQWCLDMFSFTTGFDESRFALAHARCVWKDTAFYEQAKLAPKDDDE